MARRLLDRLLLRLARRLETLVGADNVRNVKRQATVDPSAVVYPSAEIYNHQDDPKAITVGAHAHILGELLVFWNGGRIQIGEWSILGRGSRIWSQSSVTIGKHVGISHLVDIHDTNGHSTDWRTRDADVQAIAEGKTGIAVDIVSEPIVIEDHVWIGFKASILRGVHIGRGAIVAAGSVVVEDVPAWTIVAGNPARVVRELEEMTSPPIP